MDSHLPSVILSWPMLNARIYLETSINVAVHFPHLLMIIPRRPDLSALLSNGHEKAFCHGYKVTVNHGAFMSYVEFLLMVKRRVWSPSAFLQFAVRGVLGGMQINQSINDNQSQFSPSHSQPPSQEGQGEEGGSLTKARQQCSSQ